MKRLLAVIVSAVIAASTLAADFGQKTEALAKAQSLTLFGTIGTLGASSNVDLAAAAINSNPASLMTVAPGLSVSVVSADAALGRNTDQMALWPSDTNPTHLIVCNEEGAGQVGVQSVEIATGAVQNIISGGMAVCDPVRRTPWGTIIAGEENGTAGRVFEIINPLTTTGVVITGAGSSTGFNGPGAANVAFLGALGLQSFEGMAILPNGVIYTSDENRPGQGGIGNPGGAIFKFIPTNLWTNGLPPITSLSQSPFAAGTLWGLRVGRNGGNTDVGQGNEFGRGVWVQVATSTNAVPTNLRSAAATLKLTSYYRPEDMDIDLPALSVNKVRFCGTNTGQDVQASTSANGDNHYGEIYCITDGTVAMAGTISTQIAGGVTLNVSTVPEYQPLVFGSFDLAMPDNVAFQPGRKAILINEDGEGPNPPSSPQRNNDIWSCLDDGADGDLLSDACVKVMTLNDFAAESTGGIFDSTGKTYFVSIQHNDSGHGVILKVTGWQ